MAATFKPDSTLADLIPAQPQHVSGVLPGEIGEIECVLDHGRAVPINECQRLIRHIDPTADLFVPFHPPAPDSGDRYNPTLGLY